MTKGVPTFDTATGRFEHEGVHRAYRPMQLSMEREGIVADGATDNSAALRTLVSKWSALAAGTRRSVYVHGSERVIRGHVYTAPGVIFVGANFQPPRTGCSGPFVRPVDDAWRLNGSGVGANRSGFLHCDIDGESGQHGTSPAPVGPTPQVTNQAGNLPAADYAYRLAYRTSHGTGQPSPAAHAWGATGARLTWANTSSTAQVVVYGRAPWSKGDQREMAVLPAGTTSWTDNGSITTFGASFRPSDFSAPGVWINGAGTVVDHTTIHHVDGSVMSDWAGQDVATPDGTPEPWPTWMEARWSNSTIAGCGGSFVWSGPHDSILTNLAVLGNGHPSTRPNFVNFESGPLRVVSSHFYGGATYAIDNLSPAEYLNCQAEGGYLAQVRWGCAETSWIGGDVFVAVDARHPENTPRAAGFQIGDPQIDGVPAYISGVKLRNFSSRTKAAVDLQNAGATHVDGYFEGESASRWSGAKPGLHEVSLVNASAGTIDRWP